MVINPEFEKLIPALTAEEFNQLELNCIAEGIREPLIIWNDFLILQIKTERSINSSNYEHFSI